MPSEIKVVLAQPRGFCAGVVRAVDIVERALTEFGPPIYVRHEIVHNRHVVKGLKAKGLRFVDDLREVGKIYRIESEADVAGLPLPTDAPVAYITRTTLSLDDTRSIIAALRARFSDVVGPETRDICYAPQNRQSAVRDLSHVADLIIVVGARNSSNSNRLRELGADCGVASHLVADGTEIDPSWLDGVEVVGVTAGASAPEVLVQDVIETLRRLAPVSEVSVLPGIEEHFTFRLPAERVSP